MAEFSRIIFLPYLNGPHSKSLLESMALRSGIEKTPVFMGGKKIHLDSIAMLKKKNRYAIFLSVQISVFNDEDDNGGRL